MHVCVMARTGYMLAAPTIFHLITTCSRHSGHINYFGFLNQSQPVSSAYANDGPHGHHLRQPW